MSMINVETAYTDCWEECPIFEIKEQTMICDERTENQIVLHEYCCAHLEGCNHLLDHISNRKILARKRFKEDK